MEPTVKNCRERERVKNYTHTPLLVKLSFNEVGVGVGVGGAVVLFRFLILFN